MSGDDDQGSSQPSTNPLGDEEDAIKEEELLSGPYNKASSAYNNDPGMFDENVIDEVAMDTGELDGEDISKLGFHIEDSKAPIDDDL